jgi:hypothetical protein
MTSASSSPEINSGVEQGQADATRDRLANGRSNGMMVARMEQNKGIATTYCKSLASAAAALALLLFSSLPLRAQQISLQALVTPSTRIQKDGKTTTFALHGFVEFNSLTELFPYIEAQTRRWRLDDAQRQRLARELLRHGVESRVVSMLDERPLETLVTHTREELREALARVKEPAPPGYGEAFLAVQQKWKHSLNCWSASPSIPGRVLSNWYPIMEGINLYGATYDSTEHFWQAVKYHPGTTVADVKQLLGLIEQRNWQPFFERLDADPKTYLPNAYAVEFLRNNLKPEHLKWFRSQLDEYGLQSSERARTAQQRGQTPFRFTAAQDKALWGDLADVFHLLYVFTVPTDGLRTALAEKHFDGIYLGARKMAFVSEEFRSLMLEIWRTKYLKLARFREVIASIPMEIRLEHFLNDGDSPDIPIPVYVGYLNRIRELARAQTAK